ncbi:PREDICTED: uncharacterized protein LOC109479959 [Branchiostoma belcheri]|uniref:Uncharacterized protein LOC109479959 n=1 Tax=Branchiostoma belcheri TaxID=7741 RepID=A0A6P4ZU35_BRABE|nr:PREDICTED: uncharacterized protein LOC109479959 [Branchiostoma belcheri]XP_019637605.1 PREDICTED: uncharacterized protein LOC109479959 [Branchiostoma belcheri]
MGVVLRVHSSPFILTFFICVLIVFFERQDAAPVDGFREAMSSTVCCSLCVAEQCGSYVRNHISGNSMQREPRPHQGIVTTFIYQCMGFIMCLAVLLVLPTLNVKSLTTWKLEGSSRKENTPLVEGKEPIIEDQTGTNDFLRDVASLYQEAVREVDFARVGRRVGLDDYQIQEIINNEAEQLRGEAKLKYHDWNSSKSPQSRDDLRDDIVADRIKLLPDILVQYKRPQGRAAYAG